LRLYSYAYAWDRHPISGNLLALCKPATIAI
jgi:hypothetical protein